MSKVRGIDVLEAIVQEAVSQNGDDWPAIAGHIQESLSAMPGTCLAIIVDDLKAIVSNPASSVMNETLQ